MIKISSEIKDIVNQKSDASDNPLKNAPHCAVELVNSDWSHEYPRESAAALSLGYSCDQSELTSSTAQ